MGEATCVDGMSIDCEHLSVPEIFEIVAAGYVALNPLALKKINKKNRCAV